MVISPKFSNSQSPARPTSNSTTVIYSRSERIDGAQLSTDFGVPEREGSRRLPLPAACIYDAETTRGTASHTHIPPSTAKLHAGWTRIPRARRTTTALPRRRRQNRRPRSCWSHSQRTWRHRSGMTISSNVSGLLPPRVRVCVCGASLTAGYV